MAERIEWTEIMELALLAAHTRQPGLSMRELARQISETFGIPVTADSAEKKLKRIKERLDIDAAAIPQPDDRIVLPHAPQDQFVGFTLGFYDIETTDLKAFMGRMLVVSIADSWGNVVTRRFTDFERDTVIDDRGLARWAKEEFEKYDILVGWNSKLFDAPFVNARLMRGLELPMHSDKKHIDLMYYARGQFMRIGSARLDNVAKFFRVENQKTPISWDEWAMAAAGDMDALERVVEHCEADVLVLRDVFARMKSLVRIVHR